MRILVITPVAPGSLQGNGVTARRWAGFLRELGHELEIRSDYSGEPADLLIALHARKSAPAVERFRSRFPTRPVVVALTGTDLYHDLPQSPPARRSLELADYLVVLQPEAVAALPDAVRSKARVILQSCTPPPVTPASRYDRFEVCVLGHLREVKDPFRTAEAARRLPPESRVEVVQVGGALTPEMASRARREAAENPRYRWLGELPREDALLRLSGARLLCLTSRLEGGANAVSEALVCGLPVLSSRIDGSIGLLGPDYPGYLPVGDTAALADLLRRAETDAAFYAELQARCRELAPRFHPAAERARWEALLRECETALPRPAK
ncbi:MAG: selenoneine biosynthesis selenosugar synthase SenB [Armatimonadota bacterium]